MLQMYIYIYKHLSLLRLDYLSTNASPAGSAFLRAVWSTDLIEAHKIMRLAH